MSDTALSYYKSKHAEYSDKIKRIKKIQRTFVFLRLFAFSLMVFIPLIFIADHLLVAILLFILFLAIFLVLLKKFTALENRNKYLSCLLSINLHEIEAKRGNHGNFADGSQYIDPDHRYSFDFDIFGTDSLFQKINRCVTIKGMDNLAQILLNPATESSTITRRQKAFRELSSSPDFCQHFIATGMMHREEPQDSNQLIKYLNSPSHLTRLKGMWFMSKFLPALTLALLSLVITGILPFFVFLIFFLGQLGLTGTLLKPINEKHVLVTQRLSSLRKYGRLLHIIEGGSFDAPLLKSLQRYLKNQGMQPSDHIKKLSKIVEAFDNRLNIIAALVLNGLFLWDINCVLLLEQWNRRHRKQVPAWLNSIARMDAYISFSLYSFNNPGFIFPVPVGEGPVLEAVSLGHPLIPGKVRVCNDLSIDSQGSFVIITGANMAGKSTFLRATGIALVLAMVGAPVCAVKFRFRIMEVWSSMRTSDSLSRQESYFYAELKRLKHLIERIAEGEEVFVLLDEILKGTNNFDKQKGSVALLKQMLNMGSSGIIATHDLSLADMENDFPGKIINKCFEVEIADDRLHFDYLLRDGVTHKMNALILMRQMGLIKEL